MKRFADVSIAYPPQFTEREWSSFLAQLIKRLEKVVLDYDRLYEMDIEEETAFMKEKKEVVQIICDNIKDFGW